MLVTPDVCTCQARIMLRCYLLVALLPSQIQVPTFTSAYHPASSNAHEKEALEASEKFAVSVSEVYVECEVPHWSARYTKPKSEEEQEALYHSNWKVAIGLAR